MEKIQLQRVLPNEIEQRSFEIITQELRERGEQDKILPENELVVKRVIHTTADFGDIVCQLYQLRRRVAASQHHL